MARRDVFKNITGDEALKPNRTATSGYASKGASRSMKGSLSELASIAEAVRSGEQIVDLSPDALEASFVSDRFEEDASEFAAFKASIQEKGQQSPILVRPIEGEQHRYRIVFGHRRARAAMELGINVKAIVRTIDDIEHVITQGQENSIREDLTFIEKATFARKLSEQGYSVPTITEALSVDGQMLDVMNRVTKRVPEDVIFAIGKAEGVGRERWDRMGKAILKPSNRKAAIEATKDDKFKSVGSSEERFIHLLSVMEKAGRPKSRAAQIGKWNSSDKTVDAEFRSNSRSFSIQLKSKDGQRFGRFLSENLDRLHEEFLKQEKEGES
ncbi:plasmid partitioning protein RepB [Cohaesibacter marisflavi]|uniref:plasmid partitioning protein RepB n=1 Tax=Cohaesibacter marisflavi TaxID=655353 RepID=UPI0029C8C4CA|nr:plasmid partitioning protein RepB [Cohaesibacter marisflavi]